MGKLVCLIAIAAVLTACTGAPEPSPSTGVEPVVDTAPEPAPAAACDVSRFTVKAINAGFENHCRRRLCMDLKGAVTVTNGCPVPAGLQVKVTAKDAAGNALASADIWPASTNNIQPGDYVISLDYVLDYQPGMATIEVTPIAVRVW